MINDNEFRLKMRHIFFVIESLRKYPQAPAVFRKCNKDYQISGSNLTIEKATAVTVPVHAIHNDPKIFSESSSLRSGPIF